MGCKWWDCIILLLFNTSTAFTEFTGIVGSHLDGDTITVLKKSS
jgi:hypothetical protein